MKKVNLIMILLICLIALSGCKGNEEVGNLVKIDFFNISPQVITDDETALITISVSNANLGQEVVMVKSNVDFGSINPSVTYTTGNLVYFQYTPPDVSSGQTIQALITLHITDYHGNELDRIEGIILVKGI